MAEGECRPKTKGERCAKSDSFGGLSQTVIHPFPVLLFPTFETRAVRTCCCSGRRRHRRKRATLQPHTLLKTADFSIGVFDEGVTRDYRNNCYHFFFLLLSPFLLGPRGK